VRDLDATTISLATADPLPAVAAFVRRLQSMQGYRLRIARHVLGFQRRYRRHLSPEQRLVAAMQGALLCMPLAASGARPGPARPRRTHVSSTEVLDPCYRPAFSVATRYARYFEPTPLVDAGGELAGVLAADVDAARPVRAANEERA
jgi:hypothetical protein